MKNPIKSQEKTLRWLVQSAQKTLFGQQHSFQEINGYKEFNQAIPVRDYEKFKIYIDRIVSGEADIIWPGKPIYLCKTSGTTSGIKYIPIFQNAIKTHINSARNSILQYIINTGDTNFIQGKQIFIQGSPVLNSKNGVKFGRLSGIVAHHVPFYLKSSRMPSWDVNCIEDWEQKIDTIVEETYNQDMTLISGIPPWVQMYFEKIKQKSGKKIGDVFKNFSLFIYGGVSFKPYKKIFDELIGRKVNTIELYPASEGFFAFQDQLDSDSMLLLLNNFIYYEFIKINDFLKGKNNYLSLSDVKLGENYALIISTSSGLWRYNIGDTIQFTEINPFRIIVTGRIKHFISAFGEHVIGKEVESTIREISLKSKLKVREFTVAPQVNPKVGLPFHEWFIEFDEIYDNLEAIEVQMDSIMQKQNIYYKDLIQGKILSPLKITKIKKGGFNHFMKSIGKLGGQNKVPHLSNDRGIACKLKKYIMNQ
ncbi:GH3 auxin-responsive promoter family protein [Bacteroidota bacterium]|nr:GH3 auxin-responsive promoter family protein [Bacteroidota bacterium]